MAKIREIASERVRRWGGGREAGGAICVEWEILASWMVAPQLQSLQAVFHPQTPAVPPLNSHAPRQARRFPKIKRWSVVTRWSPQVWREAGYGTQQGCIAAGEGNQHNLRKSRGIAFAWIGWSIVGEGFGTHGCWSRALSWDGGGKGGSGADTPFTTASGCRPRC